MGASWLSSRDSAEDYLDLPNVRLYYRTMGSGPPLVFLHGGPALPHDYFLPSVAPLSESFQLVFFDQRGCGKSSKADDDRYDIDAMAEDLEHLCSTLHLGRINLLGHSWGGMLAQQYALRFPERINRLILSSTFSKIDTLNLRLSEIKESAPADAKVIIDQYEREGLFKDGQETYPEKYSKAATEVYRPYSTRFIQKLPPELEQTFQRIAFDVYRRIWGKNGEFVISGNLAGWNVLDRLPEVRIPTLVMVGRHDLTPVSHAEEMTRRLQDSKLVVFESSSHFSFIEENPKFIAVVRDFLSST